MELKEVRAGEAIISLLSFLDYMGDRHRPFKTVSAKAMMDKTVVLKIPFAKFKQFFDEHPSGLSRVIQVIMVRLQRVTLLALHQYLGLGMELLSDSNRGVPSDAIEEEHGSDFPVVKFQSGINPADWSYEDLKKLAAAAFRYHLKIKDSTEALFLDSVVIEVYEDGRVLVNEDSSDTNALFVVLTGCVQVSQNPAPLGGDNSKEGDEKSSQNGASVEVHKAYPGGMLGQLQVLTAEPSFFTYTALGSSYIAVVSGVSVRKYMHKHPEVAVALAMSVIDNLSPYLRYLLTCSMMEKGT